MNWMDDLPRDLRETIYGPVRRIRLSARSAGKLASDLDTPSLRAGYRRTSGLLVAAMLAAVAGLGYFSGTLAAGAGRSADDVAPHSVCIAPTVSMAVPAQEGSELSDYSFVFTKD